MAIFDMITNAPDNIVHQGDDINNRYFTIDTADLITVHAWIAFNPYIVTYAGINGEIFGFFNIIPITTECAQLFDQQAIKEEDLSIEHILHPDALPHAQFSYLAAIAIKDREQYLSRQCAAALLGAISDHFLYGYNPTTLKRIYANPTTFDGNHMVRKLGLKPVVSFKKPLKGNDIYALDVTDDVIERLQYVSQRYGRFVGNNPWKTSAPE